MNKLPKALNNKMIDINERKGNFSLSLKEEMVIAIEISAKYKLESDER
jgi:hypothetical protein